MKQNQMVIGSILGLLFLRKMIDRHLLVGIAIGMFFSFLILKGKLVPSINAFQSPPQKTSTLPYINKNPTVQKILQNIMSFRTENNRLVINEALQHINRFLKIGETIRQLDPKRPFYDLAKMERKKGLDRVVSLMLGMGPQDSIKLKKSIWHLGKVTKQILLKIGHQVNQDWNKTQSSTHGPVHLDQ